MTLCPTTKVISFQMMKILR